MLAAERERGRGRERERAVPREAARRPHEGARAGQAGNGMDASGAGEDGGHAAATWLAWMHRDTQDSYCFGISSRTPRTRPSVPTTPLGEVLKLRNFIFRANTGPLLQTIPPIQALRFPKINF